MQTSYSKALSLLSQSFHFVNLKPITPMHRDLGVKRVVYVCIHETGSSEIGLADSTDDDGVEFYHLDQLSISPAQLSASG